MSRSTKFMLAGALIVSAGSVAIFTGLSTLPHADGNREIHVPQPTALPGEKDFKKAPDQSMLSNPLESASRSPKEAGVQPAARTDHETHVFRTSLDAEKFLLADADGNKGVSISSVTSVITGDKFSTFMDQLTAEASMSSLALDITELYSHSANEANASIEGTLNIRLACGIVVCAVTATAPDKDTFDEWFKAFIENPSATPHAAGRFEKELDNGAIEYRIVFSNDAERNQVIMQP